MAIQGAEPSHKLVRIAFRADASVQIGTGHVMRCLALADVLRERGAQCDFICRPHAGHLLELIGHHGHNAIALPAPEDNYLSSRGATYAAWLGTDWAMDAEQTRQALSGKSVDWLVVDHYSLDHQWERVLRLSCQHLMVIDDLANRTHDSDLLLDQNLGRTAGDYVDLLPPRTRTLIGPQYALLRREFSQWRQYSLQRRAHPKLKYLLISMGGVDKDNTTGLVLQVLKGCDLTPDLRITVLMGLSAPWVRQVQAQATQMPWPTQVLVGADNVAQLMADSDLAIGASGSTSWERCCLGVPAIQIVLADNQKSIATALEKEGAAIVAEGEMLQLTLPALLSQIAEETALQTMTHRASRVADGDGAAKVAELLTNDFDENYPALQ